MVISLDRWRGKVAVVTGASAGIGAAIAEKLVEEGLTVVGLARRKPKLDDLQKRLAGKKGTFHPRETDITDEASILAAFKWTRDNVGPVSILVNNAGTSRATSLIDGNTKFWAEVFDTNVLGLCIATREAVKDMRDNKIDGHIVHINSTVGHVVPNYPNINVYPATKHAVTALTETLRQELNSVQSKIKITSLSPGLVETEMFEAVSAASGITVTKSQAEAFFKSASTLQAEDVADAVLYVLATPAHVQVHELMIKPIGAPL